MSRSELRIGQEIVYEGFEQFCDENHFKYDVGQECKGCGARIIYKEKWIDAEIDDESIS